MGIRPSCPSYLGALTVACSTARGGRATGTLWSMLGSVKPRNSPDGSAAIVARGTKDNLAYAAARSRSPSSSCIAYLALDLHDSAAARPSLCAPKRFSFFHSAPSLLFPTKASPELETDLLRLRLAYSHRTRRRHGEGVRIGMTRRPWRRRHEKTKASDHVRREAAVCGGAGFTRPTYKRFPNLGG